MSGDTFSKIGQIGGTALGIAGAATGNPALAVGGQILGAAGGLAGGGGGGGGGGFDVIKTDTYRIGRENGNQFKLLRRPGAGGKGGLSRDVLIENQQRIKDNIARTLDAQRALRSGFSNLKTRVQTLHPVFQNLRDESALLRAKTTGDFDVITQALLELSGDTSELRAGVRPGFGRLTQAVRQTVQNRRDEAIGNLRASLSRRRVLGSSFAEDAEARTQSEFTNLENEALSQAAVQETQLSEQLIGREQSIQESIAAVTDRSATISANLLSFDAATLQGQVQAFSLEAGLDQLEGQALLNELTTIKTDMEAFQQIVDRELRELAIAGNIASGQASIATNAAKFDSIMALENSLLAGESAGSLLDIAKSGGIFGQNGIGAVFGSGTSLGFT